MMKKIIYLSLFMLTTIHLFSQDEYQKIFIEIEHNNSELKALFEKSSAQKVENGTLNNLQNPEVELTHKPQRSLEPRNTEVEVTQSFDFPSAYKKRSLLIDNLNKQEDIQYNIRRKEIFLEAYQLIIEIVFYQQKLKYIQERNEYAEQMFQGYEALFKEGQIDILEYNKTRLNLLESRKNLKLCRLELKAAMNEIRKINGGMAINDFPQNYSDYIIPLSFEDWFVSIKEKIPQLILSETKWEMGKKNENLIKAINLPKLKAGYVAEIDPDKARSGFLIGFSVPLWQGRNTLKAAKLQTSALLYEKIDNELRIREDAQINFQKAKEYASILSEYTEIINNMDNFDLLRRSFELGRLSLIEYLQELMIFYQAVDSYLETERDYQLAIVQLQQWNM